ncbi:hypothetical protein EDD86DRAFT_219005 [Gorgonomyces haynaldii]|nr:hypothetical protein EDD86DRAFT_219005 [Gorgonomyces haynaldii]
MFALFGFTLLQTVLGLWNKSLYDPSVFFIQGVAGCFVCLLLSRTQKVGTSVGFYGIVSAFGLQLLYSAVLYALRLLIERDERFRFVQLFYLTNPVLMMLFRYSGAFTKQQWILSLVLTLSLLTTWIQPDPSIFLPLGLLTFAYTAFQLLHETLLGLNDDAFGFQCWFFGFQVLLHVFFVESVDLTQVMAGMALALQMVLIVLVYKASGVVVKAVGDAISLGLLKLLQGETQASVGLLSAYALLDALPKHTYKPLEKQKSVTHLLLFVFVLFAVQLSIVDLSALGLETGTVSKIETQQDGAYAHISGEGTDNNIAICISGNKAEALLLDGIFQHHKNNMFTKDTDLFMYIQVNKPVYSSKHQQDYFKGDPQLEFFNLTKLQEMYKPWLKDAIVVYNGKQENEDIAFDEFHTTITPARKEGWQVGKHMFYKWQQCQERLIRPSELKRSKTYDVVVRLRPDIYILERPDYKMVEEDPHKLYTIGGNCTLHPDGRFLYPHPGSAIMDMAFFGSSRVMRLVSNVYYLLMGSHMFFDLDQSFPEMFLGYCMDNIKVKTKCAGLPYDLPRGKNFELVWTWKHDWGFNVYTPKTVPRYWDKQTVQIENPQPVD